MHRNTNNFKNSKLFNFIISLLVGAVFTFAALSLFSFIMTKIDAPDNIISAMASLSLCIGSYFSGFLIAKNHRKKGLITGILCGVAIFLITFLVSVIFIRCALTMGTLSKFIMIIVCTAIGGIIGVNSKVRY